MAYFIQLGLKCFNLFGVESRHFAESFESRLSLALYSPVSQQCPAKGVFCILVFNLNSNFGRADLELIRLGHKRPGRTIRPGNRQRTIAIKTFKPKFSGVDIINIGDINHIIKAPAAVGCS